MRNILLFWFSLTLIVVTVATTLQGTTLPETYPMLLASPENKPEDINFEEWMNNNFVKELPSERSKAEFNQFLESADPVVKNLVLLRQGKSDKKSAEVKKAAEALAENLAGKYANHDLASIARFEILHSGILTQEQSKALTDKITNADEGTCSHKKLVYSNLQTEEFSSKSTEELINILKDSQQFRSTLYRKNAIKKFAHAIPVDKRASLTDDIYSYASDWNDVLSSTSWLKAEASKKHLSALKQPEKGFFLASEATRKRRCSTAKGHLIQAIEKSPQTKVSLDLVLDSAKEIGSCYRRRGANARRNFWETIQKPLEKAFGFAGWAEAKLRVGYLHWTIDEFKDARKTFHEVIKASIESENTAIQAKAIFALAQVAENEGKAVDAEAYYRDYTVRFKGEQDYDSALMSLSLLMIDRKDWVKANIPLEQILIPHAKADDNSESSAVSFALFWSGRINLELGNRTIALDRWRRLASEYYSSFYGAMGHFMVEELTGQKLALQPARNTIFKMDVLRKGFEVDDRSRIIRAERLLGIGFADDALCEIAELKIDNKPERAAIRALLLSASGQWLDAIKTFSAIPRDYRNVLPNGFEKILFPVKYANYIDEYSAKAGVDADLVKAIIRQESVFNPSARSPVGAMGLMQLMPATARLEARRLKKSYLPKKDRQIIQKKVRNKRNIYAPELNITLGVHHVKHLLNLYGSPVLALSAYNASPRAARSWKESISSDDMLAFVERIPYKETRAYVKLVLRNYFYYKRWYSGPAHQLTHLEAVVGPLPKLAQKSEAQETADEAQIERTRLNN